MQNTLEWMKLYSHCLIDVHFFFSRKYVVYEWSECKCYCIVGGGQCPKTGGGNVRSVQRREGKCPRGKCSEGNVRHIQYATPSKIVPFTGEDPGLRLIHSSLSPLEPSRRTITRAVHPFLYFFSFAVLSNKQTHRPRNIGSNRPHLRALSAILSRKNIRSKTRNKTACATSAS